MSLRSRKRRLLQRAKGRAFAAAWERVQVQLGLVPDILMSPRGRTTASSEGRGSGRTTKMLIGALVAAATGRDVVIVAHTERYARQLERRWREMAESVGLPQARLVKVSGRLPRLDDPWMRGRAGATPAVFIDHFVWACGTPAPANRGAGTPVAHDQEVSAPHDGTSAGPLLSR